MKLLFKWNISFEKHYYKSVRLEYLVRLWHPVKYRPPKKPKLQQFPNKGQTGEMISGFGESKEEVK